jgi:hypothetical protein
MKQKCGAIYILTNPSFPEYVKIGYADDVEVRVKQLNNSEAVPFSFHIYATFDVMERLTDKKLHNFIDTLNPELRSKEKVGDKIRVREFYHIKPEEIYSAFESMAEVNGTTDRLHLWKETKEEIEEEKEALSLSKNRHHFKNIQFHSSLTGKDYYSKTKEDGTLGIYEKGNDIEVPNNSKPSKRQILYSALEDLDGDLSGSNTLYQLEHKLEKTLVSRK